MKAPTGRKARVTVRDRAMAGREVWKSSAIRPSARVTRKKSNASSVQPRKLARTAERWPVDDDFRESERRAVASSIHVPRCNELENKLLTCIAAMTGSRLFRPTKTRDVGGPSTPRFGQPLPVPGTRSVEHHPDRQGS